MKTKHILSFIAFIALCWPLVSSAQKADITSSAAFNANERFEYNVSFKWGVVRGKVGDAYISNRKTNNGTQYFTQLLFRTTGLGDTFYRMRDTLETLYSAQKMPLRFEKRINEKNFIRTDEVSFTHYKDHVNAKSRVLRPSGVELDTLYVLDNTKYQVIDLLSTLALVRSYDHTQNSGVSNKRVAIPIGKDIIYLEYEYKGTESVKMPDGSTRNAMLIYLHVNDKAFKEKNGSVKVWVTQDREQIPVKIQAQLAVGYAVVDLVSYSQR